jgi:hypothetical protein
VGSALLPSELVSATTHDAAAGGGVVLRTIEASDGAGQADVLVDPTSHEPCNASIVDYGGDYAGRCIPEGSPISTSVLYVDAACAERAPVAEIPIAVGVDCPPPSGFAIELHDPVECGAPSFQVRALGSSVSTDDLFVSSSDDCTPASAAPGQELRALGDPVGAAQFGSLRIAHLGGGRLLADAFVDAQGKPLAWRPGARFYDSTLGEECSPAVLGGVTYCVPASAVADVSYLDAACQAPILGVPKANAVCEQPPPRRIVLGATSSCGAGSSVWNVGAMIAPASIYRASSLGCEATGLDLESDYYDLTPGDPTAFATLQTRTE